MSKHAELVHLDGPPIEIGEVTITPLGNMLVLLVPGALQRATWSVPEAQAAVAYVQAWIAEQTALMQHGGSDE